MIKKRGQRIDERYRGDLNNLNKKQWRSNTKKKRKLELIGATWVIQKITTRNTEKAK